MIFCLTAPIFFKFQIDTDVNVKLECMLFWAIESNTDFM